jgi:hypothetical protein
MESNNRAIALTLILSHGERRLPLLPQGEGWDEGETLAQALNFIY